MPDRDETEPNGEDELREPRRHLASPKACVIVGIGAFFVQLLIVRTNGIMWPRALFSAAFLGVFTGFGLAWVTRIRRRVRPEVADPDSRDPSAAPPVGGWANPSKSQTSLGRLGRALGSFGRSRRPR